MTKRIRTRKYLGFLPIFLSLGLASCGEWDWDNTPTFQGSFSGVDPVSQLEYKVTYSGDCPSADDGGCQSHRGTLTITRIADRTHISSRIYFNIETLAEDEQQWLIDNDPDLAEIRDEIRAIGIRTTPSNNGWDIEEAEEFLFHVNAHRHDSTTYTKTIEANIIDLKQID